MGAVRGNRNPLMAQRPTDTAIVVWVGIGDSGGGKAPASDFRGGNPNSAADALNQFGEETRRPTCPPIAGASLPPTDVVAVSVGRFAISGQHLPVQQG
jgi:hypothetical protein